MKSLFLTLFTLLVITTSLMATKRTANVLNGDWSTAGTWSPSGVPASGDTVIIPAGDTVTVSGNKSYGTLVIVVYGYLDLSNNGKLDMNSSSKVYVQTGGKIHGDGSSDQIKIGSGVKWKGSDGDVVGPQYADN